MTTQEIIRLAVENSYYTNGALKLKNKADGSVIIMTVYGYKQVNSTTLALNGENCSIQIIKDGLSLMDSGRCPMWANCTPWKRCCCLLTAN
jgi:hypothetical protein